MTSILCSIVARYLIRPQFAHVAELSSQFPVMQDLPRSILNFDATLSYSSFLMGSNWNVICVFVTIYTNFKIGVKFIFIYSYAPALLCGTKSAICQLAHWFILGWQCVHEISVSLMNEKGVAAPGCLSFLVFKIIEVELPQRNP